MGHARTLFVAIFVENLRRNRLISIIAVERKIQALKFCNCGARKLRRPLEPPNNRLPDLAAEPGAVHEQQSHVGRNLDVLLLHDGLRWQELLAERGDKKPLLMIYRLYCIYQLCPFICISMHNEPVITDVEAGQGRLPYIVGRSQQDSPCFFMLFVLLPKLLIWTWNCADDVQKR